MARSVVIDSQFPWGDDRPPKIPWSETVIYEAHVRGMTMTHPDVPDRLRGTFLGGLPNYWGYQTVGYFAPDERYATKPNGDAVAAWTRPNGSRLTEHEWHDPELRAVAIAIDVDSPSAERAFVVAINASPCAVQFFLPGDRHRQWQWLELMNTAERGRKEVLEGRALLSGRSMALFTGRHVDVQQARALSFAN
jgi:pullulanase/glycogen debranching enzyme